MLVGLKMKHIKEKIKKYEELIDSNKISEPIADQVLMDLDVMIAELESIISDGLEDMETPTKNEEE
jgi:hypothetical protein